MTELVRGTLMYLSVTVTSSEELDDQAVEMSFDRSNWFTANWQGDPGTTRVVRALVGGDDAPLPFFTPATVFVRITDSPEVPIIEAGTVQIVL